jgi:uncharacterized protein (TIGR02722 family)
MRRLTIGAAALVAAAALSACGGTSVTRMDPNAAADVSGRWNDTDSRLVAQEMISDCLSRVWLTNAVASLGKNPTVIVGRVRNQSQEHIASDTFVEDLQRELINSGKVDFVASKGEREGVRDERADQDTNSSESTRNANGQESGANFMLSGTINSIVDQEGGRAIIAYQVNLKLLNMTTNQIAWNGEKKIKKYVERARASF